MMSELIAIGLGAGSPGGNVIFWTADPLVNGAEMDQRAGPATSTTSALLPSNVNAAPARPPAPGTGSESAVEAPLNGAVKMLTGGDEPGATTGTGASSLVPSGVVARSPQPVDAGRDMVNATAVYGESKATMALPVQTKARPLGVNAMDCVPAEAPTPPSGNLVMVEPLLKGALTTVSWPPVKKEKGSTARAKV